MSARAVMGRAEKRAGPGRGVSLYTDANAPNLLTERSRLLFAVPEGMKKPFQPPRAGRFAFLCQLFEQMKELIRDEMIKIHYFT